MGWVSKGKRTEHSGAGRPRRKWTVIKVCTDQFGHLWGCTLVPCAYLNATGYFLGPRQVAGAQKEHARRTS